MTFPRPALTSTDSAHNPLVLTGSVYAHAPVRRCDPEVRIADYRASLFLWIVDSPFNPILYADASDRADMVVTDDHRALAEKHGKVLSGRGFHLGDVASTYGKGRSEAQLLRIVLEEMQWPRFTKATGRLFLSNSWRLDSEEGSVKFSRSAGRASMVDTRFYRVTSEIFRMYLAPLESTIDDNNSQTFIESVWARPLLEYKLFTPWGENFKVVGVSAT